jgi:hypothetical protein
MRRLSTLLGQELLQWPGVTVRRMFGLRAFYRGRAVFAMLPDRRALENPRAIAYKLPAGTAQQEGRKWRLFALEEKPDLGGALACLGQAYRKAVQSTRQ